MLRSLISVLAAALALAVSDVAQAALPWNVGTTIAQDAAAPAVTDGAAMVAFVAHAGTVHADVDGEGFDVAAGAGCLVPPPSVIAVGGGQVLVACRHVQSGDLPRLLTLTTHAVHEVAGAAALLDEAAASNPPAGIDWDGVGARGVHYVFALEHSNSVAALDWRTGARQPEVTEHVAFDLDAPGLTTPLCSPLRQREDGGGSDSTRFVAFQYRPPYGLTEMITFEPPSLVLQRCGRSHATVLASDPWVQAQLGSAGVVSWAVPPPTGELEGRSRSAFAYLPACDVRVRWDVAADSFVGHTQRALVVSEHVGATGGWIIHSVPLAGICDRTSDAWTLTAMNGARHVVLRAASARLRLPHRAATADLFAAPGSRARRLSVRSGTGLRFALGAPARLLRWRLPGGPWHSAHGTRWSWRIQVPRLRGPKTLAIEARFGQGGSARFALPVRPRG